jgi:nucleoid DNA-binding protein
MPNWYTRPLWFLRCGRTYLSRNGVTRMGRNPATGEAIKIKASKKVAFRAAKELKEAI